MSPTRRCTLSLPRRSSDLTPVRVAILVTLTNAGLGLALIEPLGHVGIALATGITAWMNAVLLGWLLHRQGNFQIDRKSTRLNSSHMSISYAVFCLNKKTTI